MALSKAVNDKVRLQIDVSPELAVDIENMMKECGLSTKRDLFNNAMTLLEWAIREVKQGRVIAALRTEDEKYIELQMPILAHAAKWAQGDKPEQLLMEEAGT